MAAVFLTGAFPLAPGSETIALSPGGPSLLKVESRLEKDKPGLAILSAIHSVRTVVGIAFLTWPASCFHWRLYLCTLCKGCAV